MGGLGHYWYLSQAVLQRLSVVLLVSATLAALVYSALCAFGVTPWLTMSVQFGDVILANAGPSVQLSLTALLLGICCFLPANARIMALENSHRSFQIGMRDVARAYAVSHAADRAGNFTLSGEFDSIRERMAFLREHPDLTELEPSTLEVAAQMSHVSNELARIYSDANVARARDFLIQRQQEIDEFNTRLDQAKAIATEMRRWADRVALEESVAEAQLERLCEDLAEVLPEVVEDMPPEPMPVAPAGRTTSRRDDPAIVPLDRARAAE